VGAARRASRGCWLRGPSARILVDRADAAHDRVPGDAWRARLRATARCPALLRETAEFAPLATRRPAYSDGIQILLRLLAVGAVTVAQVEEAAEAVTSSDATTASGNLSTVCALKAADATTAPGDLSTADKVCALTPTACRWPTGGPACADFCSCGASVVVENSSYCDRHRATAYRPRIAKAGEALRHPLCLKRTSVRA
jgi:hypothetical protein